MLSAAVVIGALRVEQHQLVSICFLRMALIETCHPRVGANILI